MKRQRVKNQLSPNKPQGNEEQRARAYAFLLLKFRLRSERELLSRLKHKGFSDETARNTAAFLKEKEFVDDRIFAKGWVSGRLKRPFGIRRIRQELIAKGLSREVIENAISEAKADYDENAVAEELARQRFSKLIDVEPQKAKARTYGFLLRRGFSPEIISDIIKKL